MRFLLALAALSFMLAGVARAALPTIPTHEILPPSFGPAKIIGQPIPRPAYVATGASANSPATEIRGAEGTNSGQERSNWESLNAIFAGAVALFTAALVGVGAYQGNKLKQSVTAACRSARAAQETAAIARSALVDLEQPFVHIEISDAGLVFGRGVTPRTVTFSTEMVYRSGTTAAHEQILSK
jgi:hypothetical protein